MPLVTFGRTSTLGDAGGGSAAGFEDDFLRKNRFKQVKFSLVLLLSCQAVLLCLSVRFLRYEVAADASLPENGVHSALGGGAGRTEAAAVLRNFTFQVAFVVVVVGFCFLHPLRAAHFSSAGRVLCLLLVSLSVQWALLCRGFLYRLIALADDSVVDNDHDFSFRLGVHDVTESLLAALSLLLSVSPVLLGRVAPANLLVAAAVHVPAYTACRVVNEEVLLTSDPGIVLPVHLFGPLFGVVAAAVVFWGVKRSNGDFAASGDDEGSVSPVGPALLLAAIPVLNSISAESDSEMTRAVVNTVCASVSSAVVAVAVSLGHAHLKENRVGGAGEDAASAGAASPSINVPALLHCCAVSGGVSVGAVATHALQPFGAIVLGCAAGASSSLVHLLVLPRPAIGSLAFHFLPALLSATCGLVTAALSSASSDGVMVYYQGLYQLYPARLPTVGGCAGTEDGGHACDVVASYPFLEGKARARTALQQAGFQVRSAQRH